MPMESAIAALSIGQFAARGTIGFDVLVSGHDLVKC
jgi:hypothetical protein